MIGGTNRVANLEKVLVYSGGRLLCTCGVQCDFTKQIDEMAEGGDQEWVDELSEDVDNEKATDGEERRVGKVDRNDDDSDHEADHYYNEGQNIDAALVRQTHLAPGWYKEQHNTPLPPGRWETLAVERALALTLTAVARGLVRHSNVFEIEMYACGWGFRGEWLPAWMFIPSDVILPPSAAATPALVRDLMIAYSDHKSVYNLLKTKSGACAYYASVNRNTTDAAAKILKDAEDARFGRFAYRYLRALGIFKWAGAGYSILNEYVASTVMDNEMASAGHDRFADLCRWYDNDPALARAMINAIGAYNAAKQDGNVEALLIDYDWMAEESWANSTFDGVRADPMPLGVTIDDESWEVNRDKFDTLRSALYAIHPLFNEAERLAGQDESGWSYWQLRARQAAAAWRIACTLGWSDFLRSDPGRSGGRMMFATIHWLSMDDDEVQAFLDEQVTEIDRAKEVFASLVKFPVIVDNVNEGVWLGGLSPRGHFVGSFVVLDPGD